MSLAERGAAGPAHAAERGAAGPGPAALLTPPVPAGPPRRRHRLLGYGLLVGLPLAAGAAALARCGWDGGPARAEGPGQGVPQTAVLLLVVAVVLVAARATGALAARLGQPRVIGEMGAGILLGPTALGAVAPGLVDRLFPAQVVTGIDALAQLGLVLFMFGVGQELSAVRGTGRETQGAVLVSLASFLVPFAAGLSLALWLHPGHAGGSVGPAVFALFLGCALGVTAFPVLARILSDLGLAAERTGRLSLCAAAVGDGICWVVLTAALALAQGHGATAALRTLLLSVPAALLILGPVRTVLGRLLAGPLGRSPAAALTLCTAGTAASAALTAALGVHQLIGAFLFGLAWPHGRRTGGTLAASLARLLLPFFFLGFGLSLDLGHLALDAENLLLLAVLFAVATLTKVIGAGLAGLWAGLPRTEALGLGVLMNTRGLTELVVLGIGHQAGVIDDPLFAALVVVTLATTATTGPALRALGLARTPGRPVRS